ncbi:hypothetical protein BAE44_0022341 [Dichanthelium oligosanthes]|uniref:Agenet domain-containing protein n=1 Tax=Dichanthelium oligosanthes TaxID=888268 RepID=A0A1E5UUU0_9POAL|nr:hypothetical protein BAE44_0022341 [Dichanthelium oligosanthes]
MAVGRSPALSGRRRGRKKGPSTPSPPSLPEDLDPLPPGTEVEVRVDDDGFYGSWYEATVVGFHPAAGRGSPAQYTVTYSHLVAKDGTDSVAPSHVRPRPPPPPSAPAPPPPRFLLHDFVEAFDCDGWWSGVVVAPAPAPDDPGSPVTVAFPITCEVIPFPPSLIRPRRDYVGGEWVPSRAVVAVQPKRGGVRVYKAGEKVELLREREAYGVSWFPATVAKAVDRLSYIVEYSDDQVEGGKAAAYRYWGYIRPAEYHRPRESKAHLCPGAVVEVYCDGAWTQGVVRRVVREDCEYEVSVDGEEAEQLLTKAVYQLRPLYVWNGRHWTIPSDKVIHLVAVLPSFAIHIVCCHSHEDDAHTRQANSRQQSASRKRSSSPIDAASSDEPSDPESSTAKMSRREPQQQELRLDEGSEHASVSEMGASLCASCKSLPSDHCPDSRLLLSEKNGLSMLARKIVTKCLVSKNGLPCASSGHSAPPDESVPNVIGETEVSRGALSEMVPSNGQLNTPVCGRNADEACDMLSIPEVSGGTSSCSDTEGVNFKELARKEGAGLLDNELAATVNRICKENINADVDTTATQVTKSNPLTEIPIISFDHLVQQDGSKVDERSTLLPLQNSGSSEFTTDNIQLRSCSFSGSSMPSRSAFSQISGDQVAFVKRSPAWPQIDAMDVFKKFPQQPHFRPLRRFPPALGEGMALGLMVTFASSVEDIGKSSIADKIESFKEKLGVLHHLEENGFDVQFLRRNLIKLLQIKSDHISYLTEKDQLKAHLLEKTASSSQIDERLDKGKQTVAMLEEELGRARSEVQKIVEEKERDDEDLSRLRAADSSLEEACGGAELQFQSVLAELHRKGLSDH